MKKKSVFLIVVLMVIAVLVIPFPKNFKMTGTDRDEHGEKVTIKIDATYLRYLVRDDRVKGKITFSPYAHDDMEEAVFEVTGPGDVISIPTSNGKIHSCGISRYNSRKNEMSGGMIYFDDEFEWVIIEDFVNDETEVFAGSEKYSKKEIVEFLDGNLSELSSKILEK